MALAKTQERVGVRGMLQDSDRVTDSVSSGVWLSDNLPLTPNLTVNTNHNVNPNPDTDSNPDTSLTLTHTHLHLPFSLH